MHTNELKFRVVGLTLSLILTLLAYFIIASPDDFNLKIPHAIIAILALAVLQFTVQFFFFINLWREKGPPWNSAVFVSTLSIILTIIIGSLWIMHHLDYNMMPGH